MSRDEDQVLRQSDLAFGRLREELPETDLRQLAEEVVRRMAVHGADGPRLERQRLEAFCETLIGPDPEPAADMIRGLRRGGMPIEKVYRSYLAAAAMRLGTMWEDDLISLVDVTIGTGRIYGLIRQMRVHSRPSTIQQERGIVFANVPGETHVLGIEIAADLFRRSGWEVQLLLGLTHEEIVDSLAESHALLLGVTSSGRATLSALARLVLAVRVAYPDMYILISGQIADHSPELVEVMEPDAICGTVEEALDEVGRLLSGTDE